MDACEHSLSVGSNGGLRELLLRQTSLLLFLAYNNANVRAHRQGLFGSLNPRVFLSAVSADGCF